MKRWLELHDSKLIAVEAEPGALTLRLDAFVHQWEPLDSGWRGTGWMQPVTLRLDGARGEVAGQAPLPITIADGSLDASAQRFENLVPLPFAASGPIQLQLELVGAPPLELSADALDLSSGGDARFVEDLPDDLRPTGEVASPPAG